MSPMADSNIKVEKFNGDNYSTWSSYMRAVFLSKQVWSVVDIDDLPQGRSTRQEKEFLKENDTALGILFIYMDVEYHHLILNEKYVYKAWKILKGMYEDQQKAGKIYLKKQPNKMTEKV